MTTNTHPTNNTGSGGLLTVDDQLYVFEAAAMLVVAGNCGPQEKEILMRNILTPIFSEVSRLAETLGQECDPMMQVRMLK